MSTNSKIERKIAVIGGGINGLCIARELARTGHHVTLIERGQLGQATSSASSRMLHGGLRYLEHGKIRFVYEALLERANWLARYPKHARVVENFIPIYRNQSRGRWLIGAGVKLYQWLSGRYSLGASRWWSRYQFRAQFPDAKQVDLLGAWSYFDVMMDDQGLMSAIEAELRALDVVIRTDCEVSRLSVDGEVELTTGDNLFFDVVVNAAGPWSNELLRKSGIKSQYRLDYVRGSHLIIDRPIPHGVVMQDHAERVVFALPLAGKTLLGTTEVSQASPSNQGISYDEQDYLILLFNRYFSNAIHRDEVATTTSGVRPIVKTDAGMSKASREAAIEVSGHLCSIFGGKWTSAPTLAKKVAAKVAKIKATERPTTVGSPKTDKASSRYIRQAP